MLITLLWQDGSTTTGSTWAEVEDALRAAQWVPYRNRRAFRRGMRHRAKVWSGRAPRVHSSSEDFLRGLEAAELCTITVTEGGTR